MADRAPLPDHLRLFALFGIVAVNAPFMAYPVADGFAAFANPSMADQIAMGLTNGLFNAKSYPLFSFMFGASFAFMLRASERGGRGFKRRYKGRMAGLLILGLAHACLFFPYDILVLYAVTGSVLFAMRNWPLRRLLTWGAGLIALQIPLTIALNLLEPPGNPAATFETAIMTGGTWPEVITLRTQSYLDVAPFLIPYQGFSTLGWFCLGLAAMQSGALENTGHPIWRRARLCLLPGLPLSLAGAWLWLSGDTYVLGVTLTFAAAPVAAAGYIGAMAAIAGRTRPWVAKAGGSSLSIYLGQSILLSTLFAPYGAGLWGALSPAQVLAAAWTTTALLIAFVLAWRSRFATGPFEALLRRFS